MTEKKQLKIGYRYDRKKLLKKIKNRNLTDEKQQKIAMFDRKNNGKSMSEK